MVDQVRDEIKVAKLVQGLKIFVGVGVLAAAVYGSVVLYQRYETKNAERAFAMLLDAEKLEELADKEAASLKVSREKVMKSWDEARRSEYLGALEKIRSQFPSSTAAATAGFRMGQFLVIVGKVDEAIKVYRDLETWKGRSERDVLIRALAHEALGSALEINQDFAAAQGVFEAALLPKDSPLRARAMMGLARTLNLQGKKDEARAQYQKLIDEYPNTDFERQARALMHL